MQQVNCHIASEILLEMEADAPPPRQPRTAKEFVEINSARISALIERGWPANEIINRLASAGMQISERTLLTYLKKNQARPARGRPRKERGDK